MQSFWSIATMNCGSHGWPPRVTPMMLAIGSVLSLGSMQG
jgi:hypothetical protein